jgi:hypothetical protein
LSHPSQYRTRDPAGQPAEGTAVVGGVHGVAMEQNRSARSSRGAEAF